MTMTDIASGVALWRQVADGIERGIADGRFAAGEKLPGEMEIAEIYRVNRHTVRRALATLAERGLVRAERGSGTYVEALRLADRAPICIGTHWLSAERFPGAERVYAAVRSMTKLLAHYGVRDYQRASTRITAGIVDATDAARLDLALGRPILVVDSTDVDAEGRPLITKHVRFAAERVQFLVES